ncbi:MAG TPA: LuxR C-terminal-related transcriptional regulator [Candidatus Limnocylindrales bacterium]|nr:LuxR C-terminal-related transcriptional regulator [Candidatus Limnocylindrales bacterium]
MAGPERGPAGRSTLPGGLPVLETKLVAPPSRPGIVPRPTVSSKLARTATPIVFAIAPAGYGKSTAIAQWARGDGRPVAWLSIDARDNDPYLLLGYLHVALDAISPLPTDVGAAIAAGGRSIWTSAMPRLGAAIAGCGSLILVLDDFDRVIDPDGADAVLSLAGQLAPGAQLVLIGRTSGRLPLPRLIADGQASVLGVTDLSFDHDETAAVLASVGVDLPRDDVERATAHLEGWPAGVYLTARSMRAGGWSPVVPAGPDSPRPTPDDPEMATVLAGEYLRTELLERLDADDLAFALRTSVLERLTGHLCDALLDRDDSAARLRSWERSNLFLIPLDGEHTWYRYHHLLRDVLITELTSREPQAVRDLNMRAAAWLRGQGLTEQALEHLIAADAGAEAGELLPGMLQAAWNAGRVDTALRWADWFEATPDVERRIEVVAAGSFIFRHMGMAARADRWADIGDRWRPDPADPTAEHGEALRLLGRAFGMRFGPERMLEDARRAVAPLERTDRWWIPAMAVRGIAESLSGLIDEAERTLDEAVEASTSRLASPTSVAIGAAASADIAIGRNDWATADRLVRMGQALVAANHLGEHSPGIAIDAVAARVAVHSGDRDAARSHIAHSQRVRPLINHALPWLAVRTRLDLAAAHLGLADPAGARTLLMEIRDVMIRRPNLGTLVAEVGAMQARLEQIRGGTPSATTLTVAELRLLPLLSTHLTFREIGERLFVSPNTVKTQAISIYRKLDATSRSEAIGNAAQAGLIDSAV